jgi:signal transduction histidine kinase/CheY-like chemotaxis protein
VASTDGDRSLAFLSGGGVCGALVRATAWERTPLGPPQSWPTSLKTTVGIILHSRHPMFLWWGEDLIQIYNDAYLPSFGVGKHPAAMGQRGADCWQEIWPIIKPQIDDVMDRGQPSWNVDHLVPIYRNGSLEEVYWTYGYSPVYTETGAVGGTLVVCTETTPRILAERRLGTIRALAIELLRAQDASEVPGALLSILATAERDVPFAAIYGADDPPLRVGLDAAAGAALDRALEGRLHRAGRFTLPEPIAAGTWPEPVREVQVLPLRGSPDRLTIAFGLSSRLPFDETYESFLEQIVENVVAAQARVRLQHERRNLLEKAPVPTALLTGPDHVFEIANPPYRRMVGRDVLGKAYFDAFPELRGTELREIFDRVYLHGEPYVAHEMVIPLRREDGTFEDRFFTFNLEPLRSGEDGAVTAMMAVAVDITEQVAARRALERTDEERAQLLAATRAAARAKDEFLAMLGHELRNPLAPIVTALQVMKTKESENVRREREIIERQAAHLVRLVDDLLDTSRVAQGKIELKRVNVSLSEVVARAVEVASPLFEEKRHLLRVDVPASGLELYADPIRLSQVVANLLTNAARYTPSGGEIAVVARREGDEVVLRVADNGAGIPAEHLPNLFNMFFQGPQRSDRSAGGLGLGLALVKSFVTLHGGSVSAESAGPGRGSVFEVRIPAATGAEVRPASPAEGSFAASGAPSGRRVLIVDDNADLAEVLAELLEDVGCEVRTAHDGPRALAIAADFRPTIAIVDIGLPVMDGYELASRLRDLLGVEAPRLIAMTGYGQPQDRAKSTRVGFAHHLVKPVDAKVLMRALDDDDRT